MTGVMNRRNLLAGGLAAGTMLAPLSRALAKGIPGDALSADFDRAFGLPGTAPVSPAAIPELPVVPALPLTAPPDPYYNTRLVASAQRQLARNRGHAKLWRGDIVGIADFARPSTLPRLHFVNLENGSIRSFLVAHGRGSDPEHSGYLQNFSNVPGSEATSRGAYVTCEWYTGKYGTSIRLEGMDPDNSEALDRAIVMHPAPYATLEHIAKFGKLGRSEGCFAMSPGDFNEALWHLSGGRLLYADRLTTV